MTDAPTTTSSISTRAAPSSGRHAAPLASADRPKAGAPASRPADMSPPGLEAEIERTRERLAHTIDELVERVRPANVIARVKASVRERVEALVEQAKERGRDAATQAKAKVTGVLGAANERAGHAKETVTERAGHAKEAVTERAGHAKETVAERAGHAKDVVKHRGGRAGAAATGDAVSGGSPLAGNWEHGGTPAGPGGVAAVRSTAQRALVSGRAAWHSATTDHDGRTRPERVAALLLGAALGVGVVAWTTRSGRDDD